MVPHVAVKILDGGRVGGRNALLVSLRQGREDRGNRRSFGRGNGRYLEGVKRTPIAKLDGHSERRVGLAQADV